MKMPRKGQDDHEDGPERLDAARGLVVPEEVTEDDDQQARTRSTKIKNSNIHSSTSPSPKDEASTFMTRVSSGLLPHCV